MWENNILKYSPAMHIFLAILFISAPSFIGYIFGGIKFFILSASVFGMLSFFTGALLQSLVLNLDNNLVALINKKTRNVDFIFEEFDGFKCAILNPFKIKLSKFEIFNFAKTRECSIPLCCSASLGQLVNIIVDFKLSISDINIIIKNKDYLFNRLDDLIKEEIRVKVKSFNLNSDAGLNDNDKLVISEMVKKYHVSMGFNVSDINIATTLQFNTTPALTTTDSVIEPAYNIQINTIKNDEITDIASKNANKKRFISLYSSEK